MEAVAAVAVGAAVAMIAAVGAPDVWPATSSRTVYPHEDRRSPSTVGC